MNLVQIETFLAVARTESFTKAGPLVHLSQSAVSRQIQDLEKSLGVQLLERFGGRVFLTTAGRILVEEAPRLLRGVENVRQRLRDGDIRVGVTISVCNTFLPQVLARFRAGNRSVNLSLQPGNTQALLEQLRQNELDIAVLGSELDQDDLEVCFRIHDELVLVAAPDHFLVSKKPLSPEQLNGVEFIFRERGSDSRTLVEHWLERHGVKVKELMALWCLGTIKHLVGAGLAVSALPAASVEQQVKEKSLALLQAQGWPLKRTWLVVRHAEKYVFHALTEFVEVLRMEMRSRLGK